MRAGDHMDGNNGAYAAGGFSARIHGSLHGGDVALDERRHHPAAAFVPAQHGDIRGLEHRVGAFHQGDQSFTFQQPHRFACHKQFLSVSALLD